MSAASGLVPPVADPDTCRALYAAGRAAYASPQGHRAPMHCALYHDALTGLPVGDPRTTEYARAYTTGWDAAAAQAQRDAAARLRTRRHVRRIHARAGA